MCSDTAYTIQILDRRQTDPYQIYFGTKEYHYFLRIFPRWFAFKTITFTTHF